MIKELKLTQAHLDYIKNTLDSIDCRYHDEFRLHDKEDSADYAYYLLFCRGFVETSFEVIDCSRNDVTAYIRVRKNQTYDAFDETRFVYYHEPLRTNCNVYCPDGSPRIEGYTHYLELNRYACNVLKWRDCQDPHDLLISVLFKKKMVMQVFTHPLTKHFVILYSYVNDCGKLQLLGYEYHTSYSDFPDELRRKGEHSYSLSRLRNFDKRLRDWTGSCKPTKESYTIRDAVSSLDGYLEDVCDNIMGGFAVRAFDAEVEHGINSLDVTRERDIARQIIASLSEPRYGGELAKKCSADANALCESRKQSILKS